MEQLTEYVNKVIKRKCISEPMVRTKSIASCWIDIKHEARYMIEEKTENKQVDRGLIKNRNDFFSCDFFVDDQIDILHEAIHRVGLCQKEHGIGKQNRKYRQGLIAHVHDRRNHIKGCHENLRKENVLKLTDTDGLRMILYLDVNKKHDLKNKGHDVEIKIISHLLPLK